MQQKAVLSESTLLKEFRMGGSITAMGIMETSKFLLAVVYGAILIRLCFCISKIASNYMKSVFYLPQDFFPSKTIHKLLDPSFKIRRRFWVVLEKNNMSYIQIDIIIR